MSENSSKLVVSLYIKNRLYCFILIFEYPFLIVQPI